MIRSPASRARVNFATYSSMRPPLSFTIRSAAADDIPISQIIINMR